MLRGDWIRSHTERLIRHPSFLPTRAMLQGIFPVVPTLFTDDNQIDLEAQAKVIRFAIEAGANGLVFPGVASEYNHLTGSERSTLLELLSKETRGALPLVGGASASSADEVITAGAAARVHGIEHLMVMAPHGLGHDIEKHREFFAKVASALPGAEIILQNAPSPIGAGLSAESILELVRSVPSIRYVKEETLPSGPAITAIREAGLPNIKGVFGGGGARYIIDEFDRGAIGAMPAVELTDLHVALHRAYTAGDHAAARSIYRLSLPLLVSQAIYRMRFTKHVLKERGIVDSLHVRAPLPEMDSHAITDMRVMLADLQAHFS